MSDPTKLNWTDPTTNVDGSPVAPGEISGYEVGVRDTTAAGSAAGSYPFGAKAPSTATSELISLLTPSLPKGVQLAAAVRANTPNLDDAGNPVNSAWSTEVTFQLTPPAPIPSAPTNPTVS
jgi:hypothetical protein